MLRGASAFAAAAVVLSLHVIEARAYDYKDMGAKDVRTWVGKPNVLFVDMRSPAELQRTGMIPGARNIALDPYAIDRFATDLTREIKALQPSASGKSAVVVYCSRDARSPFGASEAVKIVKELGKSTCVARLNQGFAGWKQAGLPIDQLQGAR